MIDLTKVKDIVYGGKHVKNIKDSNNRIIWSVSSTPYRKLDYIQFSGNEYVKLSGISLPLDNSIFEVTFEYTYLNNNQTIFGNGDNDRGYDIQLWGEYIFAKSSSIYSNLVDNGKYKLTVNTGSSTSNTSVSTSVYDYKNGTTKNTSRNLSNKSSLLYIEYIGCLVSGSTKSNYFKGKLGEFNYTNKGNVIIKKVTLVPCQRKSDNVCGLYDTPRQKFYQLEGTVITDGARGNVVDENWDLK